VRWQDLSLYARVIAVNTSILLVAALVLVLTPVTVSFPLAAEQGVVLGLGLLLTVLANAVILRRSFRGLAELVQRMETLDVVQPRERLQVVGGGETRALIRDFNTMLERRGPHQCRQVRASDPRAAQDFGGLERADARRGR
jgi:two-component system sensor histidine kinase UhpB